MTAFSKLTYSLFSNLMPVGPWLWPVLQENHLDLVIFQYLIFLQHVQLLYRSGGGSCSSGEICSSTSGSSSFGLSNNWAPYSFHLFKISPFCSKTIPSSVFQTRLLWWPGIVIFTDFIMSYIFFDLPVVSNSPIFWHWFSSQIALLILSFLWISDLKSLYRWSLVIELLLFSTCFPLQLS